MSKFARLGAVASLMAVATAIASPAAAASLAGSTITNTVSVAYKVDGVTQVPKTATDTFTVDRKVNLTVVQDGTTRTLVTPGKAAQVTTFLVSNATNADIDIGLAATDLGGDFALSNIKIYRDNSTTGTVGAYDAGDTLITHLDEVAAETSNIRVFVVADIPLRDGANVALENGDLANVRLTGTAHEANAAPSLGAVIVGSTSNTANLMDTVLADSNADGNTARDGKHFASDGYEIATAALSVVKSSRVVETTLNGVTNTYAIPGATVEYCIKVSNSSPITATDIDVTDELPEETSFVSGSVKVDGSVTAGGDCDTTTGTSVTDALSFTNNAAPAKDVVTGTLSTIGQNDTRTVLFRVLIK